jgi:hypothetical protein
MTGEGEKTIPTPALRIEAVAKAAIYLTFMQCSDDR